MKISEIRALTRMSQRQFAQHFGIPVGTLRNWEQGISTPPEYVFNMIFTSIRRDKMINLETIKFIKEMDRLAELTFNGIEPFGNATQDTFDSKLYYDERIIDGENGHMVVADACVVDAPDCYHHDIISYYGCDILEYKVRVINDEDDGPYVMVEFVINDDIIVIENGRWYFA